MTIGICIDILVCGTCITDYSQNGHKYDRQIVTVQCIYRFRWQLITDEFRRRPIVIVGHCRRLPPATCHLPLATDWGGRRVPSGRNNIVRHRNANKYFRSIRLRAWRWNAKIRQVAAIGRYSDTWLLIKETVQRQRFLQPSCNRCIATSSRHAYACMCVWHWRVCRRSHVTRVTRQCLCSYEALPLYGLLAHVGRNAHSEHTPLYKGWYWRVTNSGCLST